MLILGIAVAGALGAPARYLLDGFVQNKSDSRLPIGTLVVNATGSFLLGLIVGFALYHALGGTPRTILATGFCGAYTTFSSFTYETVTLVEERDVRAAAQNLCATVVIPGLAAAAGLALAAF